MPDGEEKPICYTSRTLMPAEENYPTIQKEALAIYYGASKFYQYLYGKKFCIRTDHRPLVALFSEKKGIPLMYANRLQRWATYLSSFNYEIQYIKGNNNVVADYLSRAPLKTRTKSEEYSGKGVYLQFTRQTEEWPIDNDEIRKKSKEDEELQEVMAYAKEGNWPTNVNENIKPYYNRRRELSVENETLMWGYRIVIPAALRGRLLEEAHSHHFGIVKTKTLARSYMYWPNIDQDIEDMCKSCIPCLENKTLPPKSVLTPWKIESKPWDRIHLDYLGPINNKMFLIIIDSFSKWVETYMVNNMTSTETEEKLKDAFARFGLPKTVVTDNGTQFLASNIQMLFKRNGIKHITTPVANPASNGSAENAVKTFKTNLKTRLCDPKNRGKSLSSLVNEFLFSYRTSIHCTTKETPAKLFLNRNIRTRLEILRESRTERRDDEDSTVTEQHRKAQERQVRSFGGRKREFRIGEPVMVTDYRTRNQQKWVEAKITKRIGRTTYLCEIVEGNIWKRHANQIVKRTESKTQSKMETVGLGAQSNGSRKSYAFVNGDRKENNINANAVDSSTARMSNNSVTASPASSLKVHDAHSSSKRTQVLKRSGETVGKDRNKIGDTPSNSSSKGNISTETSGREKVDKGQYRKSPKTLGKNKIVSQSSSKSRPTRQIKMPERLRNFVVDID